MKYRFLWHGLMLFLTALAVISPRFASGQKTGSPQSGPRRARPQPQHLRISNINTLPPALLTVLNNWEQSGKQIDSLQGDHTRFVYDKVFAVEKRAEGEFYYEQPDKGRIDLKAVRIGSKDKSRKLQKNGEPFSLQSDNPERWVCDGTKIIQINDVEKTYEEFVIPHQARGQNIMNGPLPFLFGMSANDAHQRYQLKLLKNTNQVVQLHVKPRWRQDAANWREAYVNLDPKTYLPQAVMMVDPSGNLETVYTFANFKINGGRIRLPSFLRKDPFQPNLPDYTRVQSNPNAQPQQTVKGQNPQKGNAKNGKIPSVIGFDWKLARAVLEAKGFQVQFLKGLKANDPKQVYHVYQQTQLEDQPNIIQLRLYDKFEQAANE